MLEPDVQDQQAAVALAGLARWMCLSAHSDVNKSGPLRLQNQNASLSQVPHKTREQNFDESQQRLHAYDLSKCDRNAARFLVNFLPQLHKTETKKTNTEYENGDKGHTKKGRRSDENNDYANSQQFCGYAPTTVTREYLRIKNLDCYWKHRVSDRPGRCL